MPISRAFAFCVTAVIPLLALPVSPALAAPGAGDCAVFQGADADLAVLANAIKTIGAVVSDDASAEDKHQAAQTAADTFHKASDLLSQVSSSVSAPDYRQSAADLSQATKNLGDFLGSMHGTPDGEGVQQARQLVSRVDELSGSYDKAHTAACSA